MLNLTLTPHREYLPAHTALQKLFLMLKVQPDRGLATATPDTTIVVVVDTSGSMRDNVQNAYGGSSASKLDIVIQALTEMLTTSVLGENDCLALVQFDDQSTVILSPTPITEQTRITTAIESLRAYSGGTYMAKGLEQALQTLQLQTSAHSSSRILLLTDGETFDEEECKGLISKFSTASLPITALGVGDEFNEDLLNALSDAAGGRSFHIVTGNAQGTQVNLQDLPATIQEEFNLAKTEVITNLGLSIKTVKGVQVNRVMRAYPSYTEVNNQNQTYHLGNASVQDPPVFILEFAIENRPESRARLAKLGLTYTIPGKNITGELPPEDLVLQFIAGEGLAVQVDPEVMHYVQQCNLDKMVTEAAQIAGTDPARAEQLLENARRMTQRVGNNLMDASLATAQDELRKTRRISPNTRKTIKMGSKGKTVKMEGDVNDISDDLIQKYTGG